MSSSPRKIEVNLWPHTSSISKIIISIVVSLTNSSCSYLLTDNINKYTEIKTCNEAGEYLGLKASDIPRDFFVKIRFVKQGQPSTTDYISDRATIIYNDEGIIIQATCG